MSNQSKIHLLFIEERSPCIDLQAEIENLGLQLLIDKLQGEGSLEVVLRSYVIGSLLPDGFILLNASTQLSSFIEGLESSGQEKAIKRIFPLQVPNGTAQAAINKYPFPAILEFEAFFNFNKDGKFCNLIIHKDNRSKFDGSGVDLVNQACRMDEQDLVKIIVQYHNNNGERV